MPLDALHRALGAKMAGFAGWQMPIQYPTGLKAEHLHTRARAGLFDVSHMGQLSIRARDGRTDTLHRQLEAALPIDFDGWPEGLQRYSYLLNEQGGIEDDLMLVNRGDEVRLVVNAGNREPDLALLRQRCPDLSIDWIDAALVALQGPMAEEVLARLDPQAAQMLFMQARDLDLLGARCFTTRSGYTGEDGYEISLPLAQAEAIVRRLMADPAVAPIGLGARDTLRLEAGLPLHGSDISPTVSPVEAGLAFAIPKSRRADGLKAGGFPGATVVLQQLRDGPRRRLVGLSSFEPVPIRAHAVIVDDQDRPVGEVTSGTVSPSLGTPVMLALLRADVVRDSGSTALRAVVRDKRPGVHLTPLPFVPKRYRR
ncbi:MAG: glycine cleavage system aminomethyltransferase GcvT [Burkholderiales bacterium]|nr:glycine cleavage system aminomethyltransferase GcvT [Burkholderiales bacterium]